MSAKIEVFMIFDEITFLPKPGQTPVFLSYMDSDGTAITPPSIVQLSGGVYKFTPVFAANQSIVYVIDTGAGNTPRYYTRYLRPEDWTIEDDISYLKDYGSGKWEIFNSGINNNKLILYKADGVTVLRKFGLYDAAGLPTTTNPFKRIPE